MARKVTLTDARKRVGLTQAQLAAKAGTSQQQIQRIERGQRPSIDLALRIAKAVSVDASRLTWA